MNKSALRNFLGELPLAAELDYALRQKNRVRKDHYDLSRLSKSLPHAVEQVKPFAQKAVAGKKILFFATLHYWIEQAAYISLALAGLGHKVTLMTLPYSTMRARHAFEARAVFGSVYPSPYAILNMEDSSM